MVMLDPGYIDEHLAAVQSFDSFGRNLCEMFLREAQKQVRESPREEVEFTATVRVKAVTRDPVERACIFVMIAADSAFMWKHLYTNPQ